MKLLLKKFFEKLAMVYLILALIWVFIAFSFDVYMLYLDFSGQDEKLRIITDELWRRLDYNYR